MWKIWGFNWDRIKYLTSDIDFASRYSADAKGQIRIFFYQNQFHCNNYALDFFFPLCHIVSSTSLLYYLTAGPFDLATFQALSYRWISLFHIIFISYYVILHFSVLILTYVNLFSLHITNLCGPHIIFLSSQLLATPLNFV